MRAVAGFDWSAKKVRAWSGSKATASAVGEGGREGMWFCFNQFQSIHFWSTMKLISLFGHDGKNWWCSSQWTYLMVGHLEKNNFRRTFAIREPKKPLSFHENHGWLTLIPTKADNPRFHHPTLWVWRRNQSRALKSIVFGIGRPHFGGSNQFEPSPYQNRSDFNVSFVDAWGESS